MSTSLASAKKRRANISDPSPSLKSTPSTATSPSATNGLTLPQVIQLVDTRLIHLEKYVAEQKSESLKTQDQPQQQQIPTEWMDEFNRRTEMLAIEIDELKNVILKLQAFTMEVNKSLYDNLLKVREEQSDEEEEEAEAEEIPEVPESQSIGIIMDISEVPTNSKGRRVKK